MKVAGRYEGMDGLRGLAAFIVVFFHFLCAYLPSFVPLEAPGTLWVAYTPLAVFYSGRFYVWVFFVLSGFVVSNSAAKRKLPLVVNLISRYMRLALPVLVSILFAWTMFRIFPNTVQQMKEALPHAFLGLAYNHNAPGFLQAVLHGLYGVFKSGVSKFNGALWTMKIELIGSFGIYLVYGLLKGRVRLAFLIGCAVVLVFFHQNYLGFALGSLLREIVVAGKLKRPNPAWGWPALLIGLLIGGEMLGWDDLTGTALPRAVHLGNSISVVLTIGAVLVVYATLTLSWLDRFLTTRPLQFLGRISFGLYLMHTPLLFTAFGQMWVAGVPVAVLLPAFLAVSVGLGYVFTLLVDEPTLKLIKATQGVLMRIGGRISGPPVKPDSRPQSVV